MKQASHASAAVQQSSARLLNFSAGPATLPLPVLEEAAAELSSWHGVGAGIMEVSHRGVWFDGVIREAEQDLRDLLGISDDYAVLFLQGGATQQFAQVPMNLLAGRSADYIVTGAWSQKAFAEAKKIGANVRLAASTEDSGFDRLPSMGEIRLDPYAAYLHLCTNETVHGVEIAADRIAAIDIPLVADMSSHILSCPVNVDKFALIYAGAQKNVGPSGVTLVIVRRDLLGMAPLTTPRVLDYALQAENSSMLNTPSTFSIYMAGLVFKWLKKNGGLARMAEQNAAKAALLYRTIDQSGGFYRNRVAVDCRSRMNVPFVIHDESLHAVFVRESEAAGMIGLKGHKMVGGLRASIYNAVTPEAVSSLCEFMHEFMRRHG